MEAFREMAVVTDTQHLALDHPLPLVRGQRVQVFVVATDDDPELSAVRDRVAQRGVREADVADAIAWARGEG